jgi:hypothetical protein
MWGENEKRGDGRFAGAGGAGVEGRSGFPQSENEKILGGKALYESSFRRADAFEKHFTELRFAYFLEPPLPRTSSYFALFLSTAPSSLSLSLSLSLIFTKLYSLAH